MAKNVEVKYSYVWDVFFDSVIPILLIILGIFFIYYFLIGSEKLVSKNSLQSDMLQAIANGGDLKAVKQAYHNRVPERYGLLDRILYGRNSYYDNDVPLSVILEDLRLRLFQEKPIYKNKAQAEEMLKTVDTIIEENTQTNPFDKLEDIQKDYFENIRIKIPSQYPLIQTELSKISDELYNKNSLVAKYLRDSTRSYVISITAFVISLVIAFVQIYQNRKKRLGKIYSDIIANAINEFSLKEGFIEKKPKA